MSFDERALIEYVLDQRWYGAKSRLVAHAQVLDSVVVRTAEPQFALALVEMRYDTGAHDIYQLLYSLRDGELRIDGLEDPHLARELVSAMRSGLTLQGAEGRAEFAPSRASRAWGASCWRPARSAPSSRTRRWCSTTS